jgi:hypothetical protein
MSSFFADLVLVLHALIVFFNIGALPLIWLGYFRKWHFVRNFAFRIVHLLLIGFIAAESLFGVICPLTTWENQLRSNAGLEQRYQSGYIAHWVHNLLFYDLDTRVFTIGYISFFAIVLITLYAVKPRLPSWWPGKAGRG